MLTAGGGSLGISEEDDARLALVDEGLQGRLLAVVGLDLAAEAVKGDGLADDGLSGLDRRIRRCLLVRLARDGLLDLGNGLADLGGLLGRGFRRRRRRFALSELHRHGVMGGREDPGAGNEERKGDRRSRANGDQAKAVQEQAGAVLGDKWK